MKQQLFNLHALKFFRCLFFSFCFEIFFSKIGAQLGGLGILQCGAVVNYYWFQLPTLFLPFFRYPLCMSRNITQFESPKNKIP